LLQKLHILCEHNSPLIHVSLNVHVLQDSAVDRAISTVAILRLLLKHQSRLTCLAVEKCNLYGYALVILSDIIQNCKRLSEFNFICNSFTDIDTHHLSEAIQHSKSNHLITTLNFMNNKMGYEGSVALASTIKSCPNLTNLKFSNQYCIHSQFNEMIMNALQHCHQISSLDLRGCNIGAKGIVILAGFLAKSASITELSVNSNDVVMLAGAMKQSKTLRKLTINKGTERLDDITLSALGDAIKTSSSLTTVDFSCCGLHENEIKILCDAVKYSNTISKVDISKNYFFGKVAIDAIADMIRYNKIVRYLDISACDISDTYISILVDAIMHNKGNLETLDLNCNDITCTGAVELIKAVILCICTITYLDLTCNNISNEYKIEACILLREKNRQNVVKF